MSFPTHIWSKIVLHIRNSGQRDNPEQSFGCFNLLRELLSVAFSFILCSDPEFNLGNTAIIVEQ